MDRCKVDTVALNLHTAIALLCLAGFLPWCEGTGVLYVCYVRLNCVFGRCINSLVQGFSGPRQLIDCNALLVDV